MISTILFEQFQYVVKVSQASKHDNRAIGRLHEKIITEVVWKQMVVIINYNVNTLTLLASMRRMCGVLLKDRKWSENFYVLLGIQSVASGAGP